MKHDRFGVYSIVITAKDSGLRVVALLIFLGGCIQLYGAVWGFNEIPSKAKSDMLLGGDVINIWGWDLLCLIFCKKESKVVLQRI